MSGRIVAFLSSLLAFGIMCAAVAQTPPAGEAEQPWMLEALPKDTLVRVARHRAVLKSSGLERAVTEALENVSPSLRGVYRTVNVWPASLASINVCFLDGTPLQRQQVVDIASEWTHIGGRVPLNFGESGNLRTCAGSLREHIRVAFESGKGIWSAVGRESVDPALFPPNEPSMNFALGSNLSGSYIKRAILHEFGHALGLEHEHQNPKAQCWDKEIDQERVINYLRDTYGWAERDTKIQMGLLDPTGLKSPFFDGTSIMIYGLPAVYYKKQDQSVCFAKEQDVISDGDRKMIATMYPPTAQQRAILKAGREESWKGVKSSLPEERRRAVNVGGRSLEQILDLYIIEE